MVAGWKAIAYLTLSEVAWQLPTHPACSMFVSNHGSVTEHPQGSVPGDGEGGEGGGAAFSGACQPSTSVYVGGAYSWYDFLCGFSNYHVEHHDFPEVSMLRLPQLRMMAPEFYEPGATYGSSGAVAVDGRAAMAGPNTGDEPYKAHVAWWPTIRGAFSSSPDFYACTGAGLDSMRR